MGNNVPKVPPKFPNKEVECIKILQQKFGRQVVGTVKDKPWKVVIKKL